VLRENARENLREQRRNVRERREEARTKIREHVRERVRAHFARLTRRVQAAINRHLKFANRIEQRIRLLAGSGQNVAEADSRISSARTELTNAQTALNDAARASEQLTVSALPREQFQTVKALVRQAVTHVRNAHRTLLSILGLVRGLHAGEGASPSPSPAAAP
jgi:ATP-dependent exoDNAse (exonuclease V) beta subunit